MTPAPAAHLARLKATYPAWSIRHVFEGYGFAACRDGYPRIWAMTLPDLEARLNAAERA